MSKSDTGPILIQAEDIFDANLTPPDIREHLGTLARTEDLRFSPDGTRLAIAGFGKSEIAVFGVEWIEGAQPPAFRFTHHTRITADCLNEPHGLDFIDNDRIVVANRGGFGEIFDLPPAPRTARTQALTSRATVKKLGFRKMVSSPGSVVVIAQGEDRATLLLCNNYTHQVTRHDISLGGHEPEILSNSVALKRALQVPDGITMCPTSGTIAVSNHDPHNILVYDGLETLGRKAKPACILHRINCPHGLRFTQDGRYLFAADAALPFICVYARDEGWSGKKAPVAFVRVMSDQQYLMGHTNPEEGGAKGLELDKQDRLLLVTSEFQAMAAFDLQAIISHIETARRAEAT